MFFLVIMLVEISSPMHWNELAWTIDEGLYSASAGNTPPPPFFFPAKQVIPSLTFHFQFSRETNKISFKYMPGTILQNPAGNQEQWIQMNF